MKHQKSKFSIQTKAKSWWH